MKNVICVVLLVSTVGCATYSQNIEMGANINPNDINTIVDGKTTAAEIIGLFGAPGGVIAVGANDIYSYKQSRHDTRLYTFTGETKTYTNELIITVNRDTGIVVNHSFTKQFDASPNFSGGHKGNGDFYKD